MVSKKSKLKARSSGGERYLDAVEVGGSKPPVPTTLYVSHSGLWFNSLVFQHKRHHKELSLWCLFSLL